MADFLDSEAEESEEEEEEDEEEGGYKTKKKKKKGKKVRAVDSDDEEEEDDEERLREELKDLIDDAPIDESDGEDSDASRGSRKRKKSDDEEFDDRLEDEDYDLLEENLGVKVERNRFKRLRRIQDEESEDEQEDHVEGERDAIANELFDEGSEHEREELDEDHVSDRGRAEVEHYDDEEEEGELSDADDFIVDDDGRPITDKKKKRKPIFTDAALQEAQDIFGVDFDYEEFEKYDDEFDEEEEEDDEYDVEEGDEDVEKRRKPKKAAKKKPTRKSIFEIYEPSELKRGHFTDLDNEIRNTDIPERMQLRDFPVTAVPDGSDELDEESEWIYKQAFCKPSISLQDGHGEGRDRSKKGPQTIAKIKKALEFMRNQHFEVPFIAFYRKEYVQPELNINDLWKVYKFDEKWCQLRSRKESLTTLFERMRDYQAEELMKNVDAPIPDHVRILRDEDIERLRLVQTAEELRDVHHHFLLHYAQDVAPMNAAWRAKERERAREARARRRARPEGEDGDEGDEPPEEDAEEPPEEPRDAETVKKAVASGPYAMCRKAKLDGFAKRFGLTPEQFGENLRDNYQRHEVEQEPCAPDEVAPEYVSSKFSEVGDVLKAAKFMVAVQLARDPLVRKCTREAFFERAKIDVQPTKKGMKEIDENHPCYSMKYLKGKPVRDLVGDQYLKLVLAEQDGLIQLSFSDHIEGLTSHSYTEEAKQLYMRDEFSKNVQEWNNLRGECVELALARLLLPDLKKELRSCLLAEAREFVLRNCCRKLYSWLKVAPYSVEFAEEDEEEWDASKGLRVMGVAYVPDFSQAAFTCLVGPQGDCTDHLRLPNLLKRKNTFREDEKLEKEADLSALRSFISSKRPHVIVVGGESREALMVAADLKEIVAQLVEDDQFPSIAVEVIDNELAKVYANSIKGENDYREFPHLLRQAISLARRMQDPLVEFSQLCSSDEEILCLRYHPLQDQLGREELLEALYLELVNRTNEVGVDVNLAVQEPYTANLVQFVCGLGPRKAQALLKTLKQSNQRLENRTQLVTSCHMGPKVFINCAGFVRIDTNSLGDSTEAYVEVLDGSRVHPETYEWARKMAVDALEYDDEDANPAGALEEILESPERLKDLDLDAFAEELERQGFGNKSITLYDIRSELNHRYKDLRSPYVSANAEQMFDLLTKETPETFFIGKMVLATVIGVTHRKPQGDQLDQANPVRNDETGLWQCPFCLKNDFPELSEVWNHFDAGGCPGKATGVRVRLDNGVSGYVHVKNLSDKRVNNPEERVYRGQIIHCRIIKIDVERFSVECTSKSSDLLDKKHEWRPPKDPYYDLEAEERDISAEEEAKKTKQRQTYIKRVIVHPSFHNISFQEAEKLMSQMDQGEVVIRPSSKGSDHLTVTWKVTDGVYQHIDVREEGKANAFSLGQSLWIGNEEFEDLDEIIARHVNPMAAHARDLLSFKYYRETEGLKDKAEEFLKDEKKKNASKIHYVLAASKNYPGKFMLSYLPRARCRHEFITVTPEGFRFRQQLFDSLGSLFRWFKEHFRDPVPGTPSTPRNMATNRTPYQTPGLNIAGMNQEAIQRVAQNLPSHMLHSLSQVASRTPHYPHTPGGYGASLHGYPNTPYTPSGQTPFMTPYHTPHSSQTPRYGQQTPSHPGPFLHPGSLTPAHRTPSHRSAGATPQRPAVASMPAEPMDWGKAAEAWAKLKNHEQNSPRMDGRATPRSHSSGSTPGQDARRTTPRYEDPPRGVFPAARASPYGFKSPGRDSLRSTPLTNASPQSMVESSLGDATPLYDEN
ncbi:transcription elongation factor SPT6 isoform X2 [Bacillus rossius redtenbacheri]|uniref:transcription elongation factor SPT6 isoform X2 n=1 Tax=Bacillus rossius redtenbacheri TaxID=93214 RepID=UPI002FDCC53F